MEIISSTILLQLISAPNSESISISKFCFQFACFCLQILFIFCCQIFSSLIFILHFLELYLASPYLFFGECVFEAFALGKVLLVFACNKSSIKGTFLQCRNFPAYPVKSSVWSILECIECCGCLGKNKNSAEQICK